jgi:hypothetical protein
LAQVDFTRNSSPVLTQTPVVGARLAATNGGATTFAELGIV